MAVGRAETRASHPTLPQQPKHYEENNGGNLFLCREQQEFTDKLKQLRQKLSRGSIMSSLDMEQSPYHGQQMAGTRYEQDTDVIMPANERAAACYDYPKMTDKPTVVYPSNASAAYDL